MDKSSATNSHSVKSSMDDKSVMRGFPRQSDYQGLPLCLVYPNLNRQYGRIKAYTNEPKLSDDFLRLINDDTVVQNMPFDFEACHLNMNNGISVPAIRRQYYGSYLMNR